MKKVAILLTIFMFLVTTSIYANNDNIVNPRQRYTYELMTHDIKRLKEKYPYLISYESLGKTKYNRDVWAVKLGRGDVSIFINASHHAREWITTNIVMEMIEYYATAYVSKAKIGQYNVKEILDQVTIYFVPMVNPDGVTLQQEGLEAFPNEIHHELIKMNNGSVNFKKWKANIDGIDLNRQYPANWEHLKKVSESPNYQFYKGKRPLETIETRLITAFTKRIQPEIAVAYHSTGRRVYWYFNNKKENVERDKRIADKIINLTNYTLHKDTSYSNGGGFTDWFIQDFNRPGFTIEVWYELDQSEVPLTAFKTIWNRNKLVGIMLADEGYHLFLEREGDSPKRYHTNVPVHSILKLLDLTEGYEHKFKDFKLLNN